MKLSDYVVDFFVKQGIHHNFFVSGGAVVHLVDSAARHPEMDCINAQHEQNGAAAADMYSRVTGNLGLVMSTSGPGATNMVTSICSAYVDSIPMVCITGQVARFRLKKREQLRQRGFQETDVVSIYKSITKYTVLIREPAKIRYELEKAVYMAKEGRPGPVVLDIPDDLQREEIDPNQLEGFVPPEKQIDGSLLAQNGKDLLQMINDAKQPIIILGAGVHSAKAEKEAIAFANFFKIPVVLTWGGAALLAENDPLNMGRIGVCGPRGGNFAVQHSDLVIAIGTRLSQMITGGKQNLFATRAKKVMIDVDREELIKFDKETFELDLSIQADLKDFFAACSPHYESKEDRFELWRAKIKELCGRYPICPASFSEEPVSRVNPYLFIKEVSKCAKEGDIIIGDTGANISWTSQAFEFKKDQRIFSAWNHTPMGYSLPASVGAALATKQDVICLIGDGGLMMCLQELATIRRHNLPVRIFLFDNEGHGIQKQTMDTWLESRYVGVNEESGLYFPDYQKLAEAFRIPFYSIEDNQDLQQNIGSIWDQKAPFFCDVKIIQDYKIVPMLKFGAGIEDLEPRLSPEEMQSISKELSETSLELAER